ncbi:MAG: hypothetical protein ACKOQL_07090, partial [Actinomycetes bacterium]
MSIPSPGYAVTIRVELPATTDSTGDLTAAVSAAGAALTALDVVESTYNSIVVDVTCNATNEDHAKKITDSIAKLNGVKVRKFSDRTFLIHLGGKLEVNSKVPLKTRDDLSRAYTPGVARISQAIAEDPTNLRSLNRKTGVVGKEAFSVGFQELKTTLKDLKKYPETLK